MALYRIKGKTPQIATSAYEAAEATVIGDVSTADNASVWSGANPTRRQRGNLDRCRSNVQEGAVLHADPGFPLNIGADVTVGHQAMLHGYTVGAGSLIGIQAVVLNGAVIGKHCLVGAGALVSERKTFPDRSLIVGTPATVKRPLTDAEVANLDASAQDYATRAAMFRAELQRIG